MLRINYTMLGTDRVFLLPIKFGIVAPNALISRHYENRVITEEFRNFNLSKLHFDAYNQFQTFGNQMIIIKRKINDID